MKIIKYIVIYIFVLMPLCMFAQSSSKKTTEDYFNEASEMYINNNSTGALKSIYNGLQIDPTNKKLKDLAEIILKKNQDKNKQNKQQQKKQQQQQKQNQQNKQNQNKQEKQQQKQEKKQGSNMKKEDAQRMLDAMKNKEKQVQQKLNREQGGKPALIDRDW